MNLQDYENVTKPKVLPEKSAQDIFDITVRALYKQKVPCFKMYERILDTDPFPEDLCLDALWDTATFNSKGHRSPLLSPLSMEDMRFLQRQAGYEELQFMSSWGLRCYVTDSLEEQDEAYTNAMAMVSVLGRRGIIRKDVIALLVALEDAHENWADSCRGYMSLSTSDKRDSKCISELYYEFSRISIKYGLDRSVLKFSQP